MRLPIEIIERSYKPSGAGTTQLFTIPAGTAVVGCWVRVDVARVGGTSVTIGDGSDVDGYATETELATTATGYKAGAGAYLAAGSGKVYASDDTVDAVLTGSPSTNPEIKVFLGILRIGG